MRLCKICRKSIDDDIEICEACKKQEEEKYLDTLLKG